MKTHYGPKEKVKDGFLYAYYDGEKDAQLIQQLCEQLNLRLAFNTAEKYARVEGRFCDIVLFCEEAAEDEDTVSCLIAEIQLKGDRHGKRV